MVLEIVLIFLVFVTALPVALFLSWLCDDELKKDRKYFWLFFIGLVFVFFLLLTFYGGENRLSLFLSIGYFSLIILFLLYPKVYLRLIKKK